MNTEIEKQILESNNITVKKKSPVTAIAILLAAIAAAVIATFLDDTSDMKMPAILLSFTLGIIAVTNFVTRKGYMVYAPTGEELKEYKIFFESREREKVLSLLEKEKFNEVIVYEKNDTNLPIKVELSTTPSNSIAIYRVYNFVPYAYEPITETIVCKKQIQ